MPNMINEGAAWAVGLTKAVEAGASSETAIRIADQAGEAARRQNQAIELFAMLGFDLPGNRMMTAGENDEFWRQHASALASQVDG